MNPYASMKTRKQALSFQNSLATPSSLATLEPWKLSIYGSVIRRVSLLPTFGPVTTHGRHWLWDHVKYPYVGSNEIVDAEQLLALLQRMEADELTIHWQSLFTSSESPRFIEKLNPSAANG